MDRFFREFFGFPPSGRFPTHPGEPGAEQGEHPSGGRPPEGFYFSGTFPNQGEPNFRFGFTPPDSPNGPRGWDDDGDGGDDHGQQVPFNRGGFGLPEAFDMMRQFDEMVRGMEDAFRGFGTEQRPPFSVPPAILQPPPPSSTAPGSLRDQMLKEPDSHNSSSSSSIAPQQQPPRQLRPDGPVLILPPYNNQPPTSHPELPSDASPANSEVNKPSWFGQVFSWPKREWTAPPPARISPGLGDGFLRELLPPPDDSVTEQQPKTPRQRGGMSGYHGVSVYTFRGADGRVEERRTYHDSFGNQEETVTRGVGDQTHTVTIKRTPSGNEEKKEDYQNMDEGDKDRFERHWETPEIPLRDSRSRSPRSNTPSDSIPSSSNTPSMFKNLFGFHFPGFPKSDR